MLNRGDPGVAFKQEQVIQKLHSDVPELRELLRWAQHHVARDSGNCNHFLERAMDVLGSDFASSGDPNKLAPKAVRKKQPEKRGQNNANNNAGTQKLDGG